MRLLTIPYLHNKAAVVREKIVKSICLAVQLRLLNRLTFADYAHHDIMTIKKFPTSLSTPIHKFLTFL